AATKDGGAKILTAMPTGSNGKNWSTTRNAIVPHVKVKPAMICPLCKGCSRLYWRENPLRDGVDRWICKDCDVFVVPVDKDRKKRICRNRETIRSSSAKCRQADGSSGARGARKGTCMDLAPATLPRTAPSFIARFEGLAMSSSCDPTQS